MYVPYGKYILAVFVMRKIQEIVVFLMINSMCSLCRIRYGNFFVFVVDGVHKNQLFIPQIQSIITSFDQMLFMKCISHLSITRKPGFPRLTNLYETVDS